MTEIDLERLTRSILSVGVGKGRGFVVKIDDGDHCVITAAHCLPKMPEAGCWLGDEPPYCHNLIGPLGAEPSFAAQVVFNDPVADIAVLSMWDLGRTGWGQASIEHALQISLPFEDEHSALVMSLDGRWIDLQVRHRHGRLWVARAGEKFAGGMSGVANRHVRRHSDRGGERFHKTNHVFRLGWR